VAVLTFDNCMRMEGDHGRIANIVGTCSRQWLQQTPNRLRDTDLIVVD